MPLTNVGRAAIMLTACEYCGRPVGMECLELHPIMDELGQRPHGVHFGQKRQEEGATVRGMLVEDVKKSLQYKMLEAAQSDNLD